MTKISWTHNPATGGRGATWNPVHGEPYPRQHPDDRGKRDKMKYWPKGLQIQEYPQR